MGGVRIRFFFGGGGVGGMKILSILGGSQNWTSFLGSFLCNFLVLS